MGKNEEYRRQLRGHRRALAEHLAKIEAEKVKPKPALGRIKLWEKTIQNIMRHIEKLERRLRR